MTTLATALEHWGHPSRETNTERMTKDSGLSFSNHPVPSSQYLFVSDIWQPDEVGEKPTIPPTNTNLPEIMQHTRSPSNTSSMMPFAGGSLYLPQASFTATNADNIKTHDALNPETRNPTAMAPLQTHFNGDPVAYDSYDSYNSKAGFSADGSAYSAISTAPSQWSYTTDWEGPTDTQHCESDPNQDQSCESDPNDVQSASSATGRRRSVGKADLSSARAVYLEKNRQAASKCRTKQKRQQEDLVETA